MEGIVQALQQDNIKLNDMMAKADIEFRETIKHTANNFEENERNIVALATDNTRIQSLLVKGDDRFTGAIDNINSKFDEQHKYVQTMEQTIDTRLKSVYDEVNKVISALAQVSGSASETFCRLISSPARLTCLLSCRAIAQWNVARLRPSRASVVSAAEP